MDDILRKALKDSLSENNDVFAGKVLSVDKPKVLCKVQSIENEELVFEDVRLRAIDDAQDKGFVLFPKVGSTVLIGQIKNTSAYYVAMYSEIDKVKWATDAENLKDLLADLLTAIKAITVTTGVGPSGTPINVASFVAIENRLNNFFE
jgi:hypothetical protein